VPHGTVLEVTQRVVTPEGIPRLRICDGWISERLRGGNEDTVVEVLKHVPPAPIKYRIKRGEGAMVSLFALSGLSGRGRGASASRCLQAVCLMRVRMTN
jgi:hypothetical protein